MNSTILDGHSSRACAFRLLITTLALSIAAPALGASYLIDKNYAGAEGAPYLTYAGAYSSIVNALSSDSLIAIPSGASVSAPNKIYIASGVYDTAFTTSKSLVNLKNNIALLSITGDPDDVVITSTLDSGYNPGSGALGTTGSSTLQLRGDNVTAKGITFANSVDTPYIATVTHQAVSPQGNYLTGQAHSTSNFQAVALKVQGDQQAFLNCKFLGYQDTLYVDGGRAYFKDSYVTGDSDFIFSKGTAVFKNSTINVDGDHNGGSITAASTDKRTSNGIVFLDSTITGQSVKGNPIIDPFNVASPNGAATNNVYLGRPWGWQQTGGDAGTVFINTKMDDAIRAVGWSAWNANETNPANGKNGGDPGQDSRYAEFNSMDPNGVPLNVSLRVSWSNQLTASQAADYTLANIFSRETEFPWYDSGYAGSADPNSPNYSWAAYWGNRNSNNETNNAMQAGNPVSYSNPSWRVPGSWNFRAQILAAIPEPSSAVLFALAAVGMTRRRWR